MDSSRQERLAALIDADPQVPDNYLVLADLLREAGDVRGELISLQHSRLKQAAEAAGLPLVPSTELTKEKLSGREEEILATDLNPEISGTFYADWFCGYVWWTEISSLGRGGGWDSGPGRSLKQYLEHPSLRHLQELDLIAGTMRGSTDYLVPVLALQPRLSLRKLSIQQLRWDNANDPPRDALDFSSLWPMTPRLRALGATAHQITLGAPADRSLSSLTLNGEVRGDDVAPLIERSTTLRELKLYDLVDGSELWTRLPRMNHLAQAKVVMIEGEALDDAAVESVLQAASILAAVPRLKLPSTGESGEAAIRRRLPNVDFAQARDELRYQSAEIAD